MILAPREVVLDANVLINLMHVERLDLLAALPPLAFQVVDEVVAEIVLPDQQRQLQEAFTLGALRQVPLAGPAALTLYGELVATMQRGEAASLALACLTGALIASDERRAFLREALARVGRERLLTTPGLLLLAIRRHVLTVTEADAIKAHLESCRFKMTFASFAELVESSGSGE